MTSKELPKYDSPPAVETLMGVHFARLAGWNVIHFGELHSEFRKHYPKASLLPFVLEQRDLAQGTFNVQDVPVRAIFTNPSDSELVQVQSTMFLRNWKRTEATQAYTHYETLKPKFQADWEKFQAFLIESGLKLREVLQCEVTYINHVVRGKEWESYSDLARLLKPFAPRSSVSSSGRVYKYLPDAAAVSLVAGYQLADTGLSLQISIQSAIRSPDGSEVIQLGITAKAAPDSNSASSISESLDSCHDAVILGFDDVITESAQKLWRRHDPS